jgi:hypothetical protein
MTKGQGIDFSGVGAHHQNGVANRHIHTATECARAMMQHLHLHWPDKFHQDLWLFALDYASWLHNYKPKRDSGLAPIKKYLFCGVKGAYKDLQRGHKPSGQKVLFYTPSNRTDRKSLNGNHARVRHNFWVWNTCFNHRFISQPLDQSCLSTVPCHVRRTFQTYTIQPYQTGLG